MKLYRDWSLIVLTVIVCFQIWNPPVSAKTALSDMLLLPGDEPVRIKLPDASQYLEIFCPFQNDQKEKFHTVAATPCQCAAQEQLVCA